LLNHARSIIIIEQCYFTSTVLLKAPIKSGASTPYKRWSAAFEKLGGGKENVKFWGEAIILILFI